VWQIRLSQVQKIIKPKLVKMITILFSYYVICYDDCYGYYCYYYYGCSYFGCYVNTTFYSAFAYNSASLGF
jgi:hypothetical protein